MNRSLLSLYFLAFSYCIHARQPDTLIKKLDSLTRRTDSAKPNNIYSAACNEITKLNVPTYFILPGSGLKQAFTKPFYMKGKDWKYLEIGAGVITALTFADPPVQQFALRLRTAHAGLRRVSRTITDFGGPYEKPE